LGDIARIAVKGWVNKTLRPSLSDKTVQDVRRIWLPALAGDQDHGWGPIKPGLHFHDLRHTHKTWLIER
jgi:integrase